MKACSSSLASRQAADASDSGRVVTDGDGLQIEVDVDEQKEAAASRGLVEM